MILQSEYLFAVRKISRASAAVAMAALLFGCGGGTVEPADGGLEAAVSNAPANPGSTSAADTAPVSNAPSVANAPPSFNAPPADGVVASVPAGQPEPDTADNPVGARLVDAPADKPADFFRSSTASTMGVSVRDFGALGDGVTDDTAAINRALNNTRINADGTPNQSSAKDYNGRPRLVYLPAGVYRVSGTLSWTGCCLTVRGDGPGRTILQLADGATGFADKTRPRAVLETQGGNEAFRQQVWDLAVDTGKGNPGAIGVNYVSSNSGSMRNVRVRSGDGDGFAGVGMDRSWTGPALIKDVEVTGFDFGVAIGPGEYGPVFEGLSVIQQKKAGIRSVYGVPSIRGFRSVNTVPAFIGQHKANFLTLIDANLSGGAAGTAAIQTAGDSYLRNVKTSGYANALRIKNEDIAGNQLDEYASTRYAPFGTAATATALNLPVQETPLATYSFPDKWFRFPDAASYGNLRKLQGYLDGMEAAGQNTLYFPFATYYSYNEVAVHVPAHVERIVGHFSSINRDDRGINGGGLRLIVSAASDKPLIVEQFGSGVTIDHQSSRTVVIKHGKYRYRDAAGSGNLFLEDVISGPLVLPHPKKVWARQLNIETLGTSTPRAKTDNSTADLWILGFKTEGGGPIFNVSGNGRTELLGGFMLPNKLVPDIPAFSCDSTGGKSGMSLAYRYEAYRAAGVDLKHTIQYRETRNGQTRELRTDTPDISRQVGLLRCG